MRLFWGLLFILLGVYLYGLNFSWWNYENLAEIWRFWPLLLVLYGLALLLRPFRWGWIVVLLFFIASAGLVYNLAFTGNPILNIEDTKTIVNDGVKTFNFSQNLPSGVSSADVTINSGAVNLDVSETDEKLIEGTLASNIFEPSLQTSQQNNKMSVTLKTDENIIKIGNFRNDLTAKITNKVPVNLTVDAGASDINLNLSKIILSGLTIKSGASSVDLDLGDLIENGATVTIKSGASEIDINLPNDIGVKATIKSGLSSKDLTGFKKIDSRTYESENYADADKKINLEIDSGVSSIRVNR